MTNTRAIVQRFYQQVWNEGSRASLEALAAPDFRFQGSLGAAVVGTDAFWQIVTMVRTALQDYHCDILECVAEPDRAFARMQFSGVHVGTFRGHQPTGRAIAWPGAALFHFTGEQIREIWVISDTAVLDATLGANAQA